ncbi:sensor histidine kinase [Sulfurospirillum arcachonense]|uniref:sensor histidine kinase n=1 Tax=Sulfurospirillum arcachonense TaxID=57666 RepID=UPI00046AF02E|nr:ATP-binding protein [Sulfurospirillum arcachonense]
MIDESLLNSLSNKEKEIFKKGLEDLINQTYVIENEYKKLNESYISMQELFLQIIEVQPNALWVLEANNEIFLQNSEATKINALLPYINTSESTSEIEHEGLYYLVKVTKQAEKTIVSATDITEEKRRERLASMGQVAAHLSHEIRNPIGSVSLLASTLFKKVDIGSKPLVLEIRRAIWRVERIIKATLLFTKGLQLNFQHFYLDKLNAECELSCEQYTYSKEIDFKFDLPHLKINGDFELLVLVLQNFIFNAIDAIEEGENESGKVTLSYKEENTQHAFYITDNGKEIQNKNILFEPFKTTKTKGHGLGLALSLQIMEAHNGNIELLQDVKGFKISWEKTDDS